MHFRLYQHIGGGSTENSLRRVALSGAAVEKVRHKVVAGHSLAGGAR